MRGVSNKAYEWWKQDEAVTVTPSQAIWTAISQRIHLAQNLFSYIICIEKRKNFKWCYVIMNFKYGFSNITENEHLLDGENLKTYLKGLFVYF